MTDPMTTNEPGLTPDTLRAARWYHIGRPWADKPGLIYADSEDPHAGRFVLSVDDWPDELFFGVTPDKTTETVADIAEHIVAVHNAALQGDADAPGGGLALERCGDHPRFGTSTRDQLSLGCGRMLTGDPGTEDYDRLAYRCAQCRTVFCRSCIRRHFDWPEAGGGPPPHALDQAVAALAAATSSADAVPETEDETLAGIPADHPARSEWGRAALAEIDRLRAAAPSTPDGGLAAVTIRHADPVAMLEKLVGQDRVTEVIHALAQETLDRYDEYADKGWIMHALPVEPEVRARLAGARERLASRLAAAHPQDPPETER